MGARECLRSRRYFYPLISDMAPYARSGQPAADVPVARRVAQQVLCLPMYGHLHPEDQDRIVAAVRDASDAHPDKLK